MIQQPSPMPPSGNFAQTDVAEFSALLLILALGNLCQAQLCSHGCLLHATWPWGHSCAPGLPQLQTQRAFQSKDHFRKAGSPLQGSGAFLFVAVIPWLIDISITAQRSSACSGRGDSPLHLQNQKPLELVGRLLYLHSQESSLEIASVSIFLIKSSSVYLFVIPNVVKP